MNKLQKFFSFKLAAYYLLSLIILGGLFTLWVYLGIAQTGIHVDLARDLNELSNLWMRKIVWLGPMTSANFPASPVYYYLLFPGLLLSGGNGLSLVFSQAFFALAALGLLVYMQMKKSLLAALLISLTVGLSPWWLRASALPWNGHMYVSWVFLALTALWFKSHIFLSAFLFGISIAINPAAILALPILFYEWFTRQKKIKNLLYIFLGLLLPWAPVIIFEIITKGFLIRQWLMYPAVAGISFSPSVANISPLLNTLEVSPIQAIIILFVSFLSGAKRNKHWIICIMLPLVFLTLVTPLRQYYLLGLVCALVFITATSLSLKLIGKIILVIFITTYILSVKLPPFDFTGRSIPRLNHIVNTLIQDTNFDKTKKYAVVSVRDKQHSTPQADDFRFFLRTNGINALNIDQYPQADMLLLFIEVPDFNWKNWDDWHMQRFGNRKIISNQTIDGIEIIIYGRN